MLAQLQSGNLHFEASQEYPSASALVVGPVILPSSCPEASREACRNRRRGMLMLRGLNIFWGSTARGEAVWYIGRYGEEEKVAG